MVDVEDLACRRIFEFVGELGQEGMAKESEFHLVGAEIGHAELVEPVDRGLPGSIEARGAVVVKENGEAKLLILAELLGEGFDEEVLHVAGADVEGAPDDAGGGGADTLVEGDVEVDGVAEDLDLGGVEAEERGVEAERVQQRLHGWQRNNEIINS